MYLDTTIPYQNPVWRYHQCTKTGSQKRIYGLQKYNILKKSSSSRLMNVKNNATNSPVTTIPELSNKTDPVLKDTKIYHKDPLVQSRSNRNLSDFFIADKIYQVNRLSKNVTGRGMLKSHYQSIEAINNSVSDTGAGLPVHDASSKSTGFHVQPHGTIHCDAMAESQRLDQQIGSITTKPRSLNIGRVKAVSNGQGLR